MTTTAEGAKAPETLPENTPEAKKAEGAKAPEATRQKDVTFKCKYPQIRLGDVYYTADANGKMTVPAEVAKQAKSLYEVVVEEDAE